jgi:hypothetical protein
MNLNYQQGKSIRHQLANFWFSWLATLAEESPPCTRTGKDIPPTYIAQASPNYTLQLFLPLRLPAQTLRAEGFFVVMCTCCVNVATFEKWQSYSEPTGVSLPCFITLVSPHALYACDLMLQYRCSHLFGASTQLYVKRPRNFPGTGKVQVPLGKTPRIL